MIYLLSKKLCGNICCFFAKNFNHCLQNFVPCWYSMVFKLVSESQIKYIYFWLPVERNQSLMSLLSIITQ